MKQQEQKADTIIGYGGQNMNNNFIQWFQEQEYAYNPKPRKKGWIIWEVNRNMLLNSELEHIKQIKWKWDDMVSIGGPEWDGIMSIGGPGREK